MRYRTQRYSCCQLISAINARIFLWMDDISDDEFEKLAELVCCKNGSAIGVHKAYPSLGLDFEDHEPELDWIRQNLPASIGYYDPEYGFHNALIIAVNGNEVTIVNAAWERIEWDKIRIYNGPHFSMRKARTFRCSPTK